jgi:iron complex outermembrane receptor protein
MTYAEAVSKGIAQPVSARLHYARLTQWSTGIREYSVFENSWVAVREVSVGYNLPKTLISKIKMNSMRVSLTARNLGYFYTTTPDDINPEGMFSNRAGTFAEYGGMPYVRTFGLSLRGDL